MSEILQPNQPVRFEGRNPRPKYRRLRAGDIYLIEQEVDEQTWNQLKTMPDTAITENVLWWHDGDAPAGEPSQEKPARSKKPAKPGTDENGRYWQRMERPGNYFAIPGLAEVLGCEPTEQSVNAAIRTAFNVQTRRQISPDKLEAWAEENQMANLITVSRTARAKL